MAPRRCQQPTETATFKEAQRILQQELKEDTLPSGLVSQRDSSDARGPV